MRVPLTNSFLLQAEVKREKEMEKFYSVELSVRGIDIPYQFRLWNKASPLTFVLVKEYSDIVPRLKVGDTLNMKYYALGAVYRPESLKTAIRHVIKNDEGRFKGHYLVGLEIVEGRGRRRSH